MKRTKNSLKIGSEGGFSKSHSELIVYKFSTDLKDRDHTKIFQHWQYEDTSNNVMNSQSNLLESADLRIWLNLIFVKTY